MTIYLQHPLSAAFPGMSEEQFEAYRDAVVPMPAQIFDAMVATPWFKSMKASQRAMYAVSWCHLLARGSNQHVRRRSLLSHQHVAEVAQITIHKAKHA